MSGQVFVAHGDIVELSAHAITYSASDSLSTGGHLYPAFRDRVPTFAEQYRDLPRPARVGDTFWLPLPDDGVRQGVVVVAATGRSDESLEDKARRVVRSAVNAASARVSRKPGERPLIALPTFRIGLGGDKWHPDRSARAQVQGAREALADKDDVDVAFVCYTPANYRVFLEARREAAGPAPPGIPVPPELENALRQGECVLFVGAGLSRPAGLPGWQQLVEALAGPLGVREEKRGDLEHYLDLAQWYAERFGERALADVACDTFGPAAGARPTLAHYLLAGLPVRHVITTNYDDLMERALTALRRHPVPIVRQEEVALTGRNEGTFVVKFHGCAARRENIVLARDDYDAFFSRHPAMAMLLEGLLLNQTFFFVGYGLRDLNFRQVYSRIARMLQHAQRPAFATTFDLTPETGPLLRDQWRRKQLHLIDVPGAGAGEQWPALLGFLDRLAENVVLRSPTLLSSDAPVPTRLRALREHLAESVCRDVEALCQDPKLSAAEARQVAQVLDFLTDCGWRPTTHGGNQLAAFWALLAERVDDPAERVRLLVTALRHTERFDDAQAIRARIEESGPGRPGGDR